MKLKDLPAYKIATQLSDYVWDIVSSWKAFARYGLGKQWTDATDSIVANIAEGFGRYYKKDKIRTFYNSRAEVYESTHWTKRAYVRKLISDEQYKYIIDKL